MAARILLAAAGLTKVFPSQARGAAAAVSDATFELREGEILAVIGPNGAGKTTLVDLLATVLAPTSGALLIDGRDALADRRGAIGAIGYVPSGGRSLYPRLTVAQNLRFFAALHGFCPAEADLRARAALRLTGGSEAARTRVDRLSDGMVGRVTLARAMLHDPAVLLLDEPTRSIDPVHRPALLRAIRRYVDAPGKGAVLVTHDLGDVFDIANRVALMQQGRIAQLAPVATVRRDMSVLHAIDAGRQGR